MLILIVNFTQSGDQEKQKTALPANLVNPEKP
jgi:hypothetical protein